MPTYTKLKPECIKCTTFNPQANGSYRCACNGTCPGLEGSYEFKQGRLAFQLNYNHPDPRELNPYKYDKWKEIEWLRGWVTDNEVIKS
jgi:hypothetical protein